MINLVFVGPWKDTRLRDAAADLEKRIRGLWNLSVEEVPDNARAVAAWVEKHKNKGLMVSLDPMGDVMDSPAFSRWITASSRDMMFIVWGAEGPPDPIRLAIANKFALSRMTTSHEIARLFLMEQVYRAACMLKGHPYPK
jgi:23S rRNA (pseudouridine1915-N3)-methyltransferase